MEKAIQISENFIKGKPVYSANELLKLAYSKKSVYHSVWGIKPASVIINMNFVIVNRLIYENKLFNTIKLIKLKTNKK